MSEEEVYEGKASLKSLNYHIEKELKNGRKRDL
jgi:hypothetical protein